MFRNKIVWHCASKDIEEMSTAMALGRDVCWGVELGLVKVLLLSPKQAVSSCSAGVAPLREDFPGVGLF